MNAGLHHLVWTRNLSQSFNASSIAGSPPQIVGRSQRLWGQMDQATLKGIMLRRRHPVEGRELDEASGSNA